MEDVKQRSWFGRNWPWVLPVGGCLTVILLFVFGIGALFFGVTKMLKNATPYEQAVTLAKTNTELISILGEPIETVGMINGSISLDNEGGYADFKVPIKGAHGKAKIIVVGEKVDGTWTYKKLYVLIKDTQEEINLIDKGLEGI